MIRFLLVLLIGLSTSINAQELETDRPDQTESSAVVPVNSIQIETGVGAEFIQNSVTGAKETTIFAPTTLFRIALNQRFEFRLVNTLEHHKADLLSANESRGWHIDDLEMGTKIQLFDQPDRKTQIALMQHVAIPTSLAPSKGWGTITKLLVSHELKRGCSIGYNLGYDFQQNEGQLFTYSIALSMPIGDVIGAYFETYGDYSFSGQPVINVDGGLTFLVRNNIQLDYSFGIGLTQLMNYQAVGCSIRLPH